MHHHPPNPGITSFCRALSFVVILTLFFVPLGAQLPKLLLNSHDKPVGERTSSISCDGWLRLPSFESYVSVGDLDIPGTQITLEAVFTRTAPYSGGYNWAGDLISKHNDPTDNNYLLRPNNAEITTSNGFFTTPPICQIELNKTYHAAMTYDGATLKFYRNGVLMSSIAATGTLFQNNFQTRIGLYDAHVNNTQLIGYITEARIWNTVRTQAQIQADMNNPLTNPATQTGLLAYYTFDNLLNKQGNTAWNGTIGGSAVVNQNNPFCAVAGPNCSQACPSPAEFTIQRNICQPMSLTFKTNVTGFSTIGWNFGDGNTATGTTNPTHVYANSGTYTVTMTQMLNNCTEIVTKQINVNVEDDPTLVLTKDTAICAGTPLVLDASSMMDFCWSPTTFLSNPNSAQPTTTATQDITYFYNARILGPNRVNNGDFAQGNTGFNSAYTFANNNTIEGQYTVGAIPESWNTGMSACRDHTGMGSPNMMIVNGALSTNALVWSQTISVTPNTNYVFSTWVQSLLTTNPAQLSFVVNGHQLGDVFTASASTCNWTQHFVEWNSGNNTSITIGIASKNTTTFGNDFALDDISFAQEFIKRDSVKVTMKQIQVVANNNLTVCAGSTVSLTASGADNYTWSPASGLSNPAISNPVATINNSVRYIVTGTTIAGCSAKDTVDISIFLKPNIIVSNDTTICRGASAQLFASGGVSYSWTPTGRLDNPSIPNPVATPGANTRYYVTVTDNNTCRHLDSVDLFIRPDALFTMGVPPTICLNDSAQLNAGGGTKYVWQPVIGLSNPSIPNPKASPAVTTDYSALIIDEVCNQFATMPIRVTVSPIPDVVATSSNDIDCSNNTSQLMATGARDYSWTPANTLNNPAISNPEATPTVTTEYIVTGINPGGCRNSDTLIVKVDATAGKSNYLMPSAFSPNGDGLNDCFGLKFWGSLQNLEFSIYNRWGERIFFTTNSQQCWDGTYRGVKQDAGVFVYMIKAKSFCDDAIFRKGTFVLVR